MTKDEALKRLKEVGVKPGATIYTILRHVSSSGMSRRISLIVMRKGEPCQIDGMVEALGVAKSKRVTRYGMGGSYQSREEGLVANGAGMDMGFDLVYRLGRTMWPKGTPKPHGSRNGAPDRDGGYALKHEWL